jgi:hypothetical protein
MEAMIQDMNIRIEQMIEKLEEEKKNLQYLIEQSILI